MALEGRLAGYDRLNTRHLELCQQYTALEAEKDDMQVCSRFIDLCEDEEVHNVKLVGRGM